jgi:hypothetical protein
MKSGTLSQSPYIRKSEPRPFPLLPSREKAEAGQPHLGEGTTVTQCQHRRDSLSLFFMFFWGNNLLLLQSC